MVIPSLSLNASAHSTLARTAANVICATTCPAMVAACRLPHYRGRTAYVAASANLGVVHSLSVTATVCSSTSPTLSLTLLKWSRLLRCAQPDRDDSLLTQASAQLMCLLSLTPPPSHRLYLVCVEQLAASMMARRVPAHKLVHTPRLIRPTVSPLPLSLTLTGG
jgi:hypothetical protein